MTYTIESSSLKVSIKKTGAELCSIISKETGKEYIWQADSKVWGSHAPVLFPIIGGLKDGFYTFEGKSYKMPKHGIVRGNSNMFVEEQFNDSITFALYSDETTQKMYPFDFQFRIRFSVSENRITVTHQVLNTGDSELLFSLGAHPAFRCPVHDGANYDDYHLEFEQPEYAETHLLDMEKGLVSDETELVLDNTKRLPLHKYLFDRDALIFKNLKSYSVSLVHKENGKVVTMNFRDFPYLGIWAKPGADFVCIEPWLGIADSVDHNQQLEGKEGILTLSKGNAFGADYTIEII
jgi:galactose mutarotase-like enzyme